MEGSSQAHEVSPLRSKTRSITSAAVYVALAPNSFQCAHALSLFITSAQSATSRHRAMHVVYVLESMETSLRELDAVIRPRTMPTLRQMIPTTITIRHSRNNCIGLPRYRPRASTNRLVLYRGFVSRKFTPNQAAGKALGIGRASVRVG